MITLVRRSYLLAVLTEVLLLADFRGSALRANPRPLTVADSIETRRFAGNIYADDRISISPDHRNYAVRIIEGDLKRNGYWMEIYVGSTDSLEKPSKLRLVAKLFSSSWKQIPAQTSQLQWLGDSARVAFLWDDGVSPTQVYLLDIRTRQLKVLTHHSTDVTAFEVSENGRSVAYKALIDMRPANEAFAAKKASGFIVTQHVFADALVGKSEESWSNFEMFADIPSKRVHRRLPRVAEVGPYYCCRVSGLPNNGPPISPDGRWLVVVMPTSAKPWAFVNDFPNAPKGSAGQPVGVLTLFNIQTGQLKILLDAPYVAARIAWSPDSLEVAVGRTFLPNSTAGQKGHALAVINISSGHITELQSPPRGGQLMSLEWKGAATIRVDGRNDSWSYGKSDQGGWTLESTASDKPISRMEIREGLESSWKLVAIRVSDGAERVVLDPNPDLGANFRLGAVKEVHWKDDLGETWTGVLYYPVNYHPGHRYPLVIQTHGYSTTSFSLLGDDTNTTAFAARPLASRDIAVLQIDTPDGGQQRYLDTIASTSREGEIYAAGYRGAVRALEEMGLVDPAKVGLVGWSRTGYHVEYALTHSDFPYAAALVADNDDFGYFQYLAFAGFDAFRSDAEKIYGGPPVGERLKAWLESPDFHLDRVRTPILAELVSEGGLAHGLAVHWELYQQLSLLGKPVELAVVPDIGRSSHALVRPRQQYWSQERTVDWMDFWLNGHEDRDASKRQQYAPWEHLCDIQQQSRPASATFCIGSKH